ncbi:MAG: hypothetical protein KF752_05115 [Pirellulaceae bacterium]|nr:hypothetical protein [Pirellulaceae bacterium]
MSRMSAVAFIALSVSATVASAQQTGLSQQPEYGRRDGGSSVAQAVSSPAHGAQVKLASYGQCYADGGYASGNGPKPMGYGPMWPATGNRDCSRFYHYPYVFYPQNFRSNDYYRSSDSMYYRYPPEMQIPVYNKHWHNEYPNARRYHWGHHFLTDVF